MSWSNRVRGNAALTHMNKKTNIQALIPRTDPERNPSKILENKERGVSLSIEYIMLKINERSNK